MRHLFVVALLFGAVLLSADPALAQSFTVFSGTPSVKVSEGGTERRAEPIARDLAANLGVVISKIGGKYYWATRANKGLIAHTGGAFVTFVAIDGSGYIRTISPDSKVAASQMSPTEATYDYVEHIVLGLRSVTYYGNVR